MAGRVSTHDISALLEPAAADAKTRVSTQGISALLKPAAADAKTRVSTICISVLMRTGPDLPAATLAQPLYL